MIQNRPDGALLLNHLSQMHRDELRPLLARMATEDIGLVAMEAFEWVPAPDDTSNPPRHRPG